ncbi:hypothetical protein AB5W73_002200, partial [Neisseria gonorrhoeae]
VLGKIATIRRMPSPRPSPTGEGVGCGRFCGCRRFEKQIGFTTVDAGRLKSKKQPAQPVFLAANLNPNSRPVLSPVGEGWREGNKPQGLCFRRLRDLGEVAATWKVPSPQPSPAQGRERIAAGFAVAGGLKNRLDLQPLISGRLKSKKQPAQPD